MENGFDTDSDIRKRSEIFREVFEKIQIKSDEELETALREYSVSYFESSKYYAESIWENSPRIRSYLIGKIFSWLQIDSSQALLECGSAGDISAAIALPTTEVTSLDIDPDIFYNVSYNNLPKEYLSKIGKKKSLEYYGPKDWFGRKKRKLELVKETLPNWKMEVGDAKKIKHSDGSYDVVLVQGTPDMLDFISEMARVVKTGGFVVSIVHEEIRIGKYESAYVSEKYNSFPDYQFIDKARIKELGLERVQIPNDFKEYENLCNWGKNKSAGFVFEVFQKIEQP